MNPRDARSQFGGALGLFCGMSILECKRCVLRYVCGVAVMVMVMVVVVVMVIEEFIEELESCE